MNISGPTIYTQTVCSLTRETAKEIAEKKEITITINITEKTGASPLFNFINIIGIKYAIYFYLRNNSRFSF